MAVIYDLEAYRAPRLLNEFAQQTGSVVRMMYVQVDKLEKLEAGVRSLEGILAEASESLTAVEVRLEDARGRHEASIEALESGRVEDMMRARDEITHYRYSMLKRLHASRKA